MAVLRCPRSTPLPRQPESAPGLSGPERRLLDSLRETNLACRAKSRTDLFKACAALSLDRNCARAAHADVLMRCLNQALGRRPILFRPLVEEVSFDEAWLLRLAHSLLREDEASATFLLTSRVAPHVRRNLAFLVRNAASDAGIV